MRAWLSGIFVASLCGLAAAGGGEFEFRLRLAEHGIEGSLPVSVDDVRFGTGTLQVDHVASGRLFGSLTVGGRTLPGSGKYRVDARGRFVRFTTSSRRLKLTAWLDGSDYVGTIKDRGEIARATASVTIDASAAPALEVDVRCAVGNTSGSKSRGSGQGTGAGDQLALSAVLTERVTDTLKLSGDVRLKATGLLGDSALAISTWSFEGFGAKLVGSGGSMAFVRNPPDVTLFLVSGHHIPCCASDSEPYLAYQGDAGPAIVDALARRGYSVAWQAFVDHHDGTVHGPGYVDLLDAMEVTRDQLVVGRAFPTRTVVVAHSHGGVRAHQAILAVPDLPVQLLVDLDTSSCLFKSSHLLEPTADPVSRWDIGGVAYDDEEVVWPNVDFNLEVRSNQVCDLEPFDDGYNIRSDGTKRGLYYFDAHTDHTEVHTAGGKSMNVVIDWMLARLREL